MKDVAIALTVLREMLQREGLYSAVGYLVDDAIEIAWAAARNETDYYDLRYLKDLVLRLERLLRELKASDHVFSQLERVKERLSSIPGLDWR